MKISNFIKRVKKAGRFKYKIRYELAGQSGIYIPGGCYYHEIMRRHSLINDPEIESFRFSDNSFGQTKLNIHE